MLLSATNLLILASAYGSSALAGRLITFLVDGLAYTTHGIVNGSANDIGGPLFNKFHSQTVNTIGNAFRVLFRRVAIAFMQINKRILLFDIRMLCLPDCAKNKKAILVLHIKTPSTDLN